MCVDSTDPSSTRDRWATQTVDKPRIHDKQRGKQAGFHARVPPCHHAVPFSHVAFAILSRRRPLQIPPPQIRGSRQLVQGSRRRSRRSKARSRSCPAAVDNATKSLQRKMWPVEASRHAVGGRSVGLPVGTVHCVNIASRAAKVSPDTVHKTRPHAMFMRPRSTTPRW